MGFKKRESARSLQQLKLEAAAWAGKPSAHARRRLGFAGSTGSQHRRPGAALPPGRTREDVSSLVFGVSSRFTFQTTDFLLSTLNLPLRSLTRQFKSFKRGNDKKTKAAFQREMK